jgi:hypothetical protein
VFARFPSLRIAFAVAWLIVQAALILTAGRRINHAFSFRMFEESSTATLHLARLVEGGALPVHDEWQTRDCSGRAVRYRWHELVPDLPWLDVPLGAPYGADAALARARAAVAWVAAHTPGDCEAHGLAATVERVRNGRVLASVGFVVPR